MANVGSWKPDRLDTIHYIHKLAEARVGEGYYVISGCDVHEKGTPDMDVVVDSGEIFYNGSYVTVAGNAVAITAADGTNDRMDVIYINSAGTAVVHDGDVLAVSDPLGNAIWTQYEQPYPKTGCPTGVILALVYVPANDTAIGNAQIEDIAQYNPMNNINKISATVEYDDTDVTIGTVPANSLILKIVKYPGTTFDDSTITIGDVGDNDRLATDTIIDPDGSSAVVYEIDHVYTSSTAIHAYVTDLGSASQGSCTIMIIYA